jgi:hypothetical protein
LEHAAWVGVTIDFVKLAFLMPTLGLLEGGKLEGRMGLASMPWLELL